MNICFLSKEYPPRIIGGVGTYTYEIAQALVECGHKVCVITEALNEEGEFNEEGVCVNRVRPIELPFLFLFRDRLKMTIERLEYSYAVSKKLREIVKKYKIDVVESCEARAEGFWYYLLYRKPPLIVKLHTPESIIFRWNGDPYTLDYKIVKKLEEYWVFRADRLVAISKAMINLISRYYRFKFNDIPVNPNPINIDLFNPGTSSYIKDTSPTVLYVGRLEFRKGVHILIRTIPEVLRAIPQVKFIFIGNDCGMKQYLLKKIGEYGCSENVTFIEQIHREKLVEFYKKSTVCIVSSLWENFPYSCLEAMSCGKPLVASNIGGIAEIIENGINGLLVTPGSVNELTKAIIKILKDKAFAEKLGKTASYSIRERFNRFKIAENSIKIYESTAN